MNLNKIKKAGNNKNKQGFTLIELMVGISVITIVILGTTSLDYNRLNNRQKLEMFTHSIKTNFETTRNNSLSGKGVGTTLKIPEKWRIEYSKSGSGTVESSSYDEDSGIWTVHENILFDPGFNISKIRCLTINGVENNVITGNGIGSIEFNGIDIKLNLNTDIDANSDCEDETSKILELTVNYKGNNEVVEINSLNGLFQIK